jgi:hypothetical protein
LHAQPASSQETVPAGSKASSAQALPAAAAGKATLAIIKRGAADLKQRLQAAEAAGRALALLWTSAGSEKGCEDARRALRGAAAPDLALCEAPADMSKANEALAAAMAVTSFPTLTTFRGMQVRACCHPVLPHASAAAPT